MDNTIDNSKAIIDNTIDNSKAIMDNTMDNSIAIRKELDLTLSQCGVSKETHNLSLSFSRPLEINSSLTKIQILCPNPNLNYPSVSISEYNNFLRILHISKQ